MTENTTTTPQATEEHIAHLVETKTVVPYLYAGHVDHDDPAATPTVERMAVSGRSHRHPYPFTGKPLIAIQLEDDSRVLLAAFDRLACTDTTCATCDSIWEDYQSEINAVPEDASISGLMEAGLGDPVIIDARDLPPEAFDESDDSTSDEGEQ
ncbi:hypothetical protein KTJ89_06545 [Brevibacterium sediminis]|uniref:hypothetical protein n=1 Tax=Brevibacterium sediminis TaxID=1857024 RepID=UPI00217503C6|nr:hypothetical protein [Brevibacterium sediminis]MCS4592643.1 hypothetical protein [Brevibacterium sediminis]